MSLSDKRRKIEKKLVVLIPKLGCGIVNRIIQQIKDQDKEFIRLLKEDFYIEYMVKHKTIGLIKFNEIINKLAGPKLTEEKGK